MGEQFGPWYLESLIAVGGLGEVWRATSSERRFDGVTPAVKRLLTHLVRNDESREQFAVEQMLAISLPRHPNVVRGIEPGVVEGRPYLAFELAPGVDLRHIVAPPPTPGNTAPIAVALPRERALSIVRAACDGVAHLHAFGWVHGDVCPGNLIVDRATGVAGGGGERVTLVDLGVARRIGQGGAVRGTHAYMAPEQVQGHTWTEATDVFSLGVVLWELVSGKRLFHRGPPWLTMSAVVEDDVPKLADSALDAIARAALAKDPAQRIPTAAELGARLCN
ncbi:MAG: serine/threonine protein kinase [Deltaproteobacteria bacterium]|nr:serine/threonine protein kinase [Deltaproteobacteria bacterium]